jgi:hypothetical protein
MIPDITGEGWAQNSIDSYRNQGKYWVSLYTFFIGQARCLRAAGGTPQSDCAAYARYEIQMVFVDTRLHTVKFADTAEYAGERAQWVGSSIEPTGSFAITALNPVLAKAINKISAIVEYQLNSYRGLGTWEVEDQNDKIVAGMVPKHPNPPSSSIDPMPDSQVEENVLKALADAPDLTNQPMTTTTVYGVVTLSGSVESEALRTKAETIASRARGVQKVDDEMTLSGENSEETARLMYGIIAQKIHPSPLDASFTQPKIISNDDDGKAATGDDDGKATGDNNSPWPCISGTVILECVVEADGKCPQWHILKSVDPRDDKAVIDGFAGVHFQPATEYGHSIAYPFIFQVKLNCTK